MPKTDHRVTLTPNKIEGLKPAKPGQRYQVMDALVPGFGVRVTDKGTRTFIYRTRYPGTGSPSRREIGKCGVLTLTEARDTARRWQALVSKGIDPADVIERERAAELQMRRTTFAAVAEDFVRDKLPEERKGRDAEREIRRDLIPKWGPLPIAEITDRHVAALIKAKGRDGKIGARNLLALIKRFFRWASAQPEYGLSISPCANIRASDILGELPRPAARILSDDELFALWRATARLPYPVGPAYRMLCLTALRLNEAVDAHEREFDPIVMQRLRNRKDDERIDWRQVSKDRLVWVIPAERMKGRNGGKKQARAHAVPLTVEILSLLESLPRLKGGGYMFSTTAGKTPTWFGTKIKARLDRRMLRTLKAMARLRGDDPRAVALPHFVNHDIRRTVRSHLSRLKVTEEAREALLAHARPGIRGVYDLHDYFEEKLEALELWAARINRIVSPPANNVVQLKKLASDR